MTKKTPSLLLSFAVVWASVGQPVAAMAQGNVRVQTNGGAVNAVVPTLSVPSITTLGTLPGAVNLPNVDFGQVPSLPTSAAINPAQQALEAAQGAQTAATPTAMMARKGDNARTPDRYTGGDARPADEQGPLDPNGNPSRIGGQDGPDSRDEGGERQGNPSVFRTLVKTVVGKLSAAVTFDGSKSKQGMSPAPVMGILPLPKPNLPQGVDLDDAPVSPDPKQVGGVEVENVNIPGAKTTGNVFDAGPRVITANPSSEADVERALRELVDQDAAKYGVTSAELATVHVKRVAGEGNQADTIYAYFRQQRQGTNPDGSANRIAVHGTYLSFTVKVIAGKPVVMSAMAKLYPSLTVDTRQRLSDDELKAQAEARIGIPPNSGVELEFMDRKVIYSKGAWHAANLYRIEGLPFMIAIDIATGEAFAWDARMGVLTQDLPGTTAPTATAGGDFKGRVETTDSRPNGQAQYSNEPLRFLKVTLADGRTVETDENGKIDVQVDKPTTATAVLAGRYAIVNDQARRPIKISVTLTPGQRATVVANETGNDEFQRSQANVYVAVNRVNMWVRSKGIKDSRIDKAIVVNVNIDDECNAYYDYKSLNFFKSSRNCSDTAKPGVVMHEWGHYLDDMIGGITNGGLSEGWGDILSMYILNSPIIGDGFLKNRTPNYIRHGENTRPFSDNDEVHDQGEVWMGFAWKLRKALIASLGEAAGAAAAESIVLPTLYAKAADIPSAINQVLLNAMDKDGNIQYEKEIRGAAKAHGLDLPKNPGLAASFMAFLTSPMRGVKAGGVQIESLLAGSEPGGPLLSAPGDQPQVPMVKATVSFTAGRLIAGRIEREIIKYCEFHDLKYSLKSFGGVLSKDYILKLEGPKDKVDFLVSEIQRISRQ